MSFIRKLISGAAIAVMSVAAAGAQDAGDYPNRPIRVMVPFAPGGGADILARIVEAELSKRLGQQIIVENRGGAGTIPGTSSVVKAAPDGYTLLLTSSTISVVPALYKNVPYDTLTDLTPISLLAAGPVVLVVHSSTGIKSVKELIQRAKEKPGTLTFGSGGNGSPLHLGLELFQKETGTQMVHVPYKGSGPATADLIAGHLSMMFAGIAPSRPTIERGGLIALAVTSKERSKALPDVPTFTELGLPGVDAGTTWGVLGPKDLPKPIVDKLQAELAAVMKLPAVTGKLDGLGYIAVASTPAEYAATIKSDMDKWLKLSKEIGIVAE